VNSSQATTVNRHMRGGAYAADEPLLRAFKSLWRLLQRGTCMVGRGIFRSSDYQARQHGWQIVARHGGLSRTYRDPRFDDLAACTTCSGHGRNLGRVTCPDCRGSGRVSLAPGVISTQRRGRT
jgi:hypothetical protein